MNFWHSAEIFVNFEWQKQIGPDFIDSVDVNHKMSKSDGNTVTQSSVHGVHGVRTDHRHCITVDQTFVFNQCTED